MLVGDDYQPPPIMPGISANKADPKPSYGSVFAMGIVKKDWMHLIRLGKVFKLKTSKRSLSNENLLSTCLKEVRGDSIRGLSKENINKMMQFHLNSYHWRHDQVNEIKNYKKQYTCLQQKKTGKITILKNWQSKIHQLHQWQ